MKDINKELEKLQMAKDTVDDLCIKAQSKENGRLNDSISVSHLTLYIFSKIIEHNGFYQTSLKELRDVSGRSSSTVNRCLARLRDNNLIAQYSQYSLKVNGEPRLKNGKRFMKQSQYMLVATQDLVVYLSKRDITFDFIDLDTLHQKGKENMYEQTIVEEYLADLGIWRVSIYKTDFMGGRTLERIYDPCEIHQSIAKHKDAIDRLEELAENPSELIELPSTEPLCDDDINEQEKWRREVDYYEDAEEAISITPKSTVNIPRKINRKQGKGQGRKQRNLLGKKTRIEPVFDEDDLFG